VTCAVTDSEVTILRQNRNVYIVITIIIIINTTTNDHGPASYAAMHCRCRAAVLFLVTSFLLVLMLYTQSVLSTVSSALFTHTHTHTSHLLDNKSLHETVHSNVVQAQI